MPSVGNTFQDHVAANPTRLPRTDELYRYEANRNLGDWFSRLLDAITRRDIEACCQLFNERRIRDLIIVDTYSRLSPAIDVRPQYRGTDVVETLERITGIHGTPKTIRLDTPEFISKALELWAWFNGVMMEQS
ncbi:MAG: hypothetical protein OXF33_00355 [Rhodospirillales bacterium]|nr:hypothetical protein [Rhodospirillales bacterium]